MAGGGKSSIIAHPAFVPVAYALSAALVIAGLAFFFTRAGFGGPSQSAQNGSSVGLGTQGALEAYIVGAVMHPGVYHMPNGARIQDLLKAAGGSRLGADLVRVNLAAFLFDGEEVYVPLIGEPFPTDIGGIIMVNINVASAETMHLQLGISLKTADKIVTYRQTHGSFTSVAQLLLVPISRSIYDRIKSMVTV
jgi:competence protein ComEA